MYKRLIKGITSEFLGQIINLVGQILLIPFFTLKWGNSYYGEWLIVFSMCQYLMLTDIGINYSVSSEIAMAISRNEISYAEEIFSNGLTFILSISIFVLFIVFSVSFSKSLPHILNITLFKGDLQKIFLGLGLYIILIVNTSFLLSIFKGLNSYFLQKNIDNGIRLSELFAIILGLEYDQKAIGIVLILLSLRLFVYIYLIIFIKRKYDWFKIKLSLNKKKLKSLALPSLGNMLLGVCAMFYYQGTVLIVGKYLGAIFVPAYNAMNIMLKALKQGTMIINFPLYSEYSTLFGKNDKEAARRVHRTNIIIVGIIAFISCSICSIFGNDLLEFWSSSKLSVTKPYFTLAIISIFLQCIWHASSAVLVSSNRNLKIAIIFSLTIIVAYIFILMNILKLGMTAIGIGALIIDVTMFFSTLYLSLHFLKSTNPSKIKAIVSCCILLLFSN